MKMMDIFNSEELSNSDKLVGVAEVIQNIRTNYGNLSVELNNDGVNTRDGFMDIGLLSVNDKLAIAKREFKQCVTYAVEHCKCTTGAMLDKEIESNVAVNDILANLMQESGSSYI